MNTDNITIKKVRTGRKVNTYCYKAYIDNKLIRYKGTVVSSDTKQSLIDKLKYFKII